MRPYWCSLQYLNETNANVSIDDYLAQFDDLRKTITFYNVDDPPKEFKLFGIHPFMTEDETNAISAEIDELIKNTDLTVAQSRTCLCTDERMMEHHHLFDL